MNLFENLDLNEPPLTITADSLLAEGRKRVRRRRLLTLTATPLAVVGGGALAVTLLTGGLSTNDHAVVPPASTPTVAPAPTAPQSTATPNAVVTPASTPTVAPAPTAPQSTATASTNPGAGITGPSQPALTNSPSESAGPSPDTVRPTGTGTRVTDKPGIFIGVWSGHGRTLTVHANGSANLDFRSGVDCSQSQTPSCDDVRGSGILFGGHVTLHITRVVTANRMSKATATVISSNDPAYAKGSERTLVLDGDVITLAPFGDAYCGEKAKQPERDACGA